MKPFPSFLPSFPGAEIVIAPADDEALNSAEADNPEDERIEERRKETGWELREGDYWAISSLFGSFDSIYPS